MSIGGKNDETIHEIYIYHINDISTVICITNGLYRKYPGTSYHGIGAVSSKSYIKAASAIDYITGQPADLRIIQLYCECLDGHDCRSFRNKHKHGWLS
ncbi:MAG: hypothetical protein K0R92_1327 [Lachnospiraceae bacterium]|nr:hypothetical protein [Lachnospiraceae bacterium]